MIPQRRNSSFLLLLAFPLMAGTAAAQGFEGTITMTFSSTVGERITSEGVMKTATRGDRTVNTVLLRSGPGVPGGGEVRTITDRKANTLIRLTAMPAGMSLPPAMTGGVTAKGIILEQPLSNTADLGGGGTDTHPGIRKLGTSEIIAGLSCDDYEITEQKAAPIRACITTTLGAFVFPMSGRGMMGGPASPSPRWDRAFGGKPGFPLKMWGGDGKVTLQVTEIDRTPVADSAFAIPEGYVKMPGRGG